MPKQHNYACDRCGTVPGATPDEARSKLVSKVAQFKRTGFKGGVLRSRVVAWLCEDCLAKDSDFTAPERGRIEEPH